MRNFDLDNFPIEEVCSDFICRFQHLKNESVILCGIGAYSQILIEQCSIKGFNFVAYLDNKLVGHVVHGLPVININEVKNFGKHIIITTSQAFCKQKYKEISILEQQGIEIYYPNGSKCGNLGIKQLKDFDVNYTIESLYAEICKHDVISFDVFDTLLLRRTFRPDAVFEIIGEYLHEPDYYKLRSNLKDTLKMDIKPFLSIYDIYEYMDTYYTKLKISLKELIEMELKIEKSITVKSEVMCDLLQYVRKLGKSVIITSDMYYTESMIRDLLEYHNIKGFEQLYVSCDRKADKKTGSIWKLIRDDYPNYSILHIDDNVLDIKGMKENNVSFFKIKCRGKLVSEAGLDFLRDCSTSYADYIALGAITSKLLNNPFAITRDRECPKINSPFDLGYIVFGPVVYLFINWIVEKSIYNKENALLFLGRDGYLWNNLYQYFVNYKGISAPKSIYFLTSRQAAMRATICSLQDLELIIHKVSKPRSLTIAALILDFFGVEVKPDQFNKKYYYMIDDYELIKYISENYLDKIIDNAKICKENYKKYIDNLNIGDCDKVSIVDFLCGGTCQMLLQSIIGKQLGGYYWGVRAGFLKKDGYIDLKRSHTLYDKIITYNDSEYFISEAVTAAEVIFSSPDEQLLHFDCNGEPVFKEGHRDFSQIQECHNGIKTYFDFMLCNNVPPSNLRLADGILGLLTSGKCDFSQSTKDMFLYLDLYSNSKPIKMI